MKALIGGAAAGLVVAAFFGVMGDTPQLGAATQDAQSAPAPAASATCTPASVPNLTAEQTQMVKVGIDAAKRAGVGDPGAVIIVATGLVESDLRDLDYGDRDSIGWLQQRPSTGWENAGDPVKAADDFFAALKRVQGWQSMPPGDAAQAVQRSGHPARYGQRIGQATQIVAAVTGAKCIPANAAPVGTCPPSGSPAERGLQPAALRGLRCGAAAFPVVKQIGGVGGRPNKSDHPSGRAVDFMIPAWSSPQGNANGWAVARWFEANAADMNVSYIIFDDKVWRPSGSRSGWRQYTHPNGATANPTLRHLDHVHVSFK